MSNSHWALVVAFIRKREICWYDSVGTAGHKYTNAILKWLQQESWVTYGYRLDPKAWVCKDEPCPQQVGTIDCGIYAMLNADLLLADLPLDYDPTSIPNFRLVIALNILNPVEHGLNYPF